MSTHRQTWKRTESAAAAIFGVLRRPLSGSNHQRPDQAGDDATHERLWIEAKLRATWSVWSLWHETRVKAVKAGKVPVLVLREKGKQGALVVCHQADLRAVAVEYLAAADDADLLEVEALVRTRRGAGGAVAFDKEHYV